jgi:hypothetical protein
MPIAAEARINRQACASASKRAIAISFAAELPKSSEKSLKPSRLVGDEMSGDFAMALALLDIDSSRGFDLQAKPGPVEQVD